MKSKFMLCDRNTMYLMPPSVQDWLPKGHLARFVVDIVDQLDLTAMEKKYSDVGRKAYPIQTMLGLLFYGYITGVSSSRKIEQATYESVPFRFIAANYHPDHDTIAKFRKQFLKDLEGIFLQILMIASEMGMLKMGNIATDGTKIKANANKHKALSWEYANKLEKQLKEEIRQLMEMAYTADAKIPDRMDLSEEFEHRDKRLKVIEKAKQEIEKRAQERFKKEQIEYEKKMIQRRQHEKKKLGKKPKPPTPGPKKKDQVNLTEKSSRIMPQSGGGFLQGYNGQASADTNSLLIVTNHVSQKPNDKQELVLTIEKLKTVGVLIKPCDNLLADAGYYSKKNVQLCDDSGITPFIAQKRDLHNKSLMRRFEEPDDLPEGADTVTKMKHRLKTDVGKKLYAKRKSTIEPVFGIIKNVMKFRAFSLRGFEAVKGEWNLVCIAWNIKRMFALQA